MKGVFSLNRDLVEMIYADNAATTKIDEQVFNDMLPWLKDEYGNVSQSYSFARKPKKALLEARTIIAECINASPEEIFFTSGGTESDNWAIKGSALSGAKEETIITSTIEHHAILRACASIEEMGASVAYVRPDRTGTISSYELNRVMAGRAVKLVSVMFSNNEIGTIEPIHDLVDCAHEKGAFFHTDAVQAIGHVHIDVETLGVDMLSASAHKFNGPKGIGFLFIKKGTPIKAFCDGGAQEAGMRAGTENIAGIVGMATALRINCEELTTNQIHISSLENELIKGLQGLDYIRNGAKNHVPGNISLSFKNADGEAILHRMDLKGICISTGSACDSVNTNLSHVIREIAVPAEYAQGTIRISLGKNNCKEDVIKIAKALKEIIGE